MDKEERRLRKIERQLKTKRSAGSTSIFSSGGGSGGGGGPVDLTTGVTGILPPANGGTGTGTAFTAGSIVFAGASGVYTQDNSNLFFDNTNNRFLVGNNSAAVIGITTPNVQTAGLSGVGYGARRYSADTTGSVVVLAKSRATSVGSVAIVQNGDSLGRIDFVGDDGVDLESVGARIIVNVDGTPGSNDMPGVMSFWTTPDGAMSPTERLRITSAGAWGLAGGNYGTSGYVFTSNGSGAAPTWQAPAGISGLTTEGITYATSATTIGTTTSLVWNVSSNRMEITLDDNTNSSPGLILLTKSRTSTTGFGNMGAGIHFRTEPQNGNFEIGGKLSVQSYDITAAAEYYEMVFNVMGAGADQIQGVLTGAGNFGLGITTNSGFGTSASIVLGMANGTAPSTSPADLVQIYALDLTTSELWVRNEAGAITQISSNIVTAPSTSIGVGIVNYYGTAATNFLGDPVAWAQKRISGTTYKIPLYT